MTPEPEDDTRQELHVPTCPPADPPERTLAEKIAAVMGRLGRVAKNGRNEFHKYDYATEGDVADGVREACAAEGIAILPTVTKLELVPTKNSSGKEGLLATVYMEYTITDGSGTHYRSNFVGMAADNAPGDKAIYKAMTGCHKYMMLKTFSMSTGDDADPEREEDAPPRRQQAPAQNQQSYNQQSYNQQSYDQQSYAQRSLAQNQQSQQNQQSHQRAPQGDPPPRAGVIEMREAAPRTQPTPGALAGPSSPAVGNLTYEIEGCNDYRHLTTVLCQRVKDLPEPDRQPKSPARMAYNKRKDELAPKAGA